MRERNQNMVVGGVFLIVAGVFSLGALLAGESDPANTADLKLAAIFFGFVAILGFGVSIRHLWLAFTDDEASILNKESLDAHPNCRDLVDEARLEASGEREGARSDGGA